MRKERQKHRQSVKPRCDVLSPPPDNALLPPRIIRTPSGQEKYSAVLLRFAEPLLADITDDYADFNSRISMAVFVWNYALLPASQRRAVLREIQKSLPWIERLAFKKTLSTLVKRKETDFATYHWQIIMFRVIESHHEFRVEVMAELSNAA